MATYEYKLNTPPSDRRSRELWLQNAAGMIIFEDARQYAIEKINNKIDKKTREEVIAGINNAIYGMMMIFDKASGELSNSDYSVSLEAKVNLVSNNNNNIIDHVSLSDGDGMCMEYHAWLEGDYGEDNIAIKKGRE